MVIKEHGSILYLGMAKEFWTARARAGQRSYKQRLQIQLYCPI